MDTCFKMFLKTYAVHIETNDYSTLGEFALLKEPTKTKHIRKKSCNCFN